MLLNKLKIITFIVILNFLCLSCASNSKDVYKNIFVDLKGDDTNRGDISEPFKTLTKALSVARTSKDKAVTIWLRGGVYSLDKTIQITAVDTRNVQYPLIISAYQDEIVNLVGAKSLPYWSKVVDSNILSKLTVKSKKQVYVTDLNEYDVNDFGLPNQGGVSLFYRDKKMVLARYPNNGLMRVGNLVEPNTKVVRNYSGSKKGKFHYTDSTINRWVGEKDVWLNGYWFWNWRDENQRVNNIDVHNKTISIEPPYHFYGYRQEQEYFAFNILAELDSPNEWYLDRDNGKLYFYPPDEIMRDKPPMLAVVNNLISLSNASNITFKNLNVAYSKKNGISIVGGENNLIDNVVVKHIGNKGIIIKDSDNSTISSSEIYSIGSGAIAIEGGDRSTLKHANICAINNKIHDYATIIQTAQPGVSLSGVGNCAKNNEIYNAPHIGIFFKGNNHLIEYNNIHHVVTKANDAGAIYVGRDWTARGSIIKHNYLHDIQGYNGKGAKGVYVDDESSGVIITGNIFDNVYDSVFIGGGRDNIVDKNLFINSVRSIHIDTRGVTWAKKSGIKQLTSRLNDVPYNSPIWKNQYPKLSNVLSVNPRLPDGNIISNNVFYDDKWNYVFDKAKPYILFENNHHLPNSSPTNNYQIKAPLKGFSNIPFEKIGVK
ncbi:right-handed parallel beta-helix repeat-containing protein [Colwellia sp. RE-S-Sl-9]